MAWLILLHGAIALTVVAFGRQLGRNVFVLAAVAPAVTFGWLVANASTALDVGITQQTTWVAPLGLELDLRLNGIGLLMGLLVAGIGVLVLVYSRWYFHAVDVTTRVAGLLVAFAGAMFGLVVADNVFVLFGFWELTTVTSYLLIGVEDQRAAARAAAQQAFLVTAIGGLALLAGLVLLGQAGGTWSLTELLADPPSHGVVPAALVLVLIGAFTKSAQVPFHFWLPGAMSAPTPVSAYLHSATMVKAGVYLIALLAPAFASTVGFWRPLVIGVGIATMVWGGARALRQTDLKLLAAYGTVSQLGFMVALVGAGVPALTFAGCAVILAHALFKATIFLVVGIVDHQAGSRDLRDLDGLWRHLPVTAVLAAIAVASMAGIPLLFGFVAKEAALQGFVDELGSPGWTLATAGIVVGSALTFAYGARFLLGGFGSFGPTRQHGPERRHDTAGPHEPGWLALGPAAVLAALTVVLGLAPGLGQRLVAGAAGALDDPADALAGAAAVAEHLSLWHGFTMALGLSALAVVAGVGLVLAHRPIERWQRRHGGFPGGTQAYGWSVRELLRGADRVTGLVQNGSLPVYLSIIVLTLVVLPGVALVQVRGVDLSVELAESPLQAAVAALVIVAAIATALAGRRFAAVLLVGAVGYGVTVLFVIQGAPDLALTQLLIETLALVLFVLVLRHLPDRFRPSPGGLARWLRVVIALAVGGFVAGFALVAASSRTEVPVSVEQVQRAEPEGGGRNVVNVIINDIRGLDTLGEITVLVTASLGVATLVTASRRRSPDDDGEEVTAREPA